MTFEIYGLENPSTKRVQYVGLSKNAQKRYKQHTSPSRASKWIQDLLKEGLKPTLLILEDNLPDLATARKREQHWIFHYEKQGCQLENLAGNEGAIREREEREERYQRTYAEFASNLPPEEGHLLTTMILAGYDLVGWYAWDLKYRAIADTIKILNEQYGESLNYDEIETAKITFNAFGYKWVGDELEAESEQ